MRTLDKMATVRPAGTGWVASSAAASTSSPKPPVVMTPACSNSVSWKGAASASPVLVNTVLVNTVLVNTVLVNTVRTGMAQLTRRAVRANLRGLPNDSR